ncbi:MAG: glycosyltransferase family 2 protein [Streptococcaceae bacterium]|jgi:glucosyltransferase|nr:glycosyltransferase family 2 protein [Streptococcaceae bacterium]
MAKLAIIVPCYNEEAALPSFLSATGKALEALPESLDVLYFFVNDGSTDGTLELLREIQGINVESIHYLSFSRNFGKEAAIFAGLEAAQAVNADYIALMDADLQDPPELLLEMWQTIQNPEIDAVAARRVNRGTENLITSAFSRLFYRIMAQISETPVLSGVRDYRLMTQQVVASVLELSEVNRFSKGLFTWVGYNTSYIEYDYTPRVAGETHMSFWERTKYALDAFVDFSEAPLNLAVYTGLLVTGLTILAIIVQIFRQAIFHNSVSGWTSMVAIVLLCFGVLLTMLGIVGKYIAKIFTESKHRPIYIVKERK